MIEAFFLSLAQLGDRRVLAVLAKSLLATLAIFAALGMGLWFALAQLGQFAGLGGDGLFAALATLLLFVLAWWLLFRAVAVAVLGVFADEVVAAVEAKHYPQAHAQARTVPLARGVAMGLGSALRTVGVNALLLPAYLLLLITGVGTAALFFVANAWLLGRDLGDMVAARHMPAVALAEWRGTTRLQRWTLGAIGTALFLVPFLNLLAPVLGAAMATHAFHRGRR
jgi:CysZ protein